MTALQAAGGAVFAFMLCWNARLIRSTRRQRNWPRAEAHILGPTRWPWRYRLRFTAANGAEVATSCTIDMEGPRPAPGEALGIIYDPRDPSRCEEALTPVTIAGLRLIGFAAMAGGAALLVWG